jgi:hypothetical protein
MSIDSCTPDGQATNRPHTPDGQAASQQDTDWTEWYATTRPMTPVRAPRQAAPAPAPRQVAPAPAPRQVGVGVDEGKLWAGGAASAVVVGLVALVGVLVSRWLFKVPLLAPSQDGAFGDVHTATLILVAMGAALVATALVHLLMLGTLRPLMFFGWIVALVTTIAVVFPFGTTALLDAKIATAIVNLAIGLATGMLVGGIAARSIPGARPTSYDF